MFSFKKRQTVNIEPLDVKMCGCPPWRFERKMIAYSLIRQKEVLKVYVNDPPPP